MTDLDDDGSISVFAKGSQLLFTCSEGHWWTVEASSVGAPDAKPSRSRVKEARSQVREVDLDDAQLAPVREFADKYGTEPLRAIGMRVR